MEQSLDNKKRSNNQLDRSAQIALWGGILFSFVFAGIIALAGQRLDSIQLLPDAGASWYYWKLPNPTFWTRATAWGFYLLHQLTIWGLIYYAQKNVKKYSKGLHKVNYWALGANAFFILLHFVQTHLWYDGLAQDVSIFSSQGSVIVLLVWVLLMENNRRGMFFGKKLPIGKSIIQFAKKYHGYFFAWAIIYTFWYHPMVSTSGHLIGFIYMFLLMLQGSLFFTRIHINRWWMVTQEATVAIHGTLVAVMQGNGLWPMFLFGFSGIFVITQMYGIPLKNWQRITILAAYIVSVVGVYANVGFSKIFQIFGIPLIEYTGAVVLALLFGGGLWLYGKLKPQSAVLEANV
jgi:hypothetical protein